MDNKKQTTMDNEKRTTEATLELAYNGYVLRMDAYGMMLVYEGTKLPDEIGGELLSDLDDLIDNGEHNKFKITVTIEPL